MIHAATIQPMCGRYAKFLPAEAFARIFVSRACWFSLIASLCWLPAQAAELDGMQLRDTMQVEGKTLHLNGFGRRTYSLLRIHIYAAGLYLERLSTDADEILASPGTKLLNIRFEHNVSMDAGALDGEQIPPPRPATAAVVAHLRQDVADPQVALWRVRLVQSLPQRSQVSLRNQLGNARRGRSSASRAVGSDSAP